MKRPRVPWGMRFRGWWGVLSTRVWWRKPILGGDLLALRLPLLQGCAWAEEGRISPLGKIPLPNSGKRKRPVDLQVKSLLEPRVRRELSVLPLALPRVRWEHLVLPLALASVFPQCFKRSEGLRDLSIPE